MGLFTLFRRQKPKINVQIEKKEGFDGWIKCSDCQEMLHQEEVSKNLECCPKCGFHFKFSIDKRIDLLADEGTFEEMFSSIAPKNPLKFYDSESYTDRIKKAQKKTGEKDAVRVGKCHIAGQKTMLGVLNFAYMGGSMGSVVGEKITRMIETAIKEKIPVVMVCSSGGARMQESIFSLMQMAKTSAALAKLSEMQLPYISVLTHPTTGGVTASFASLGDVILAEPKALIGFAGPRVIEQTMRQKLPETAQKSEFLLQKGMIDGIVSRKDLKETVGFFLEMFTGNVTQPQRGVDKLDALINASTKMRQAHQVEIVSTK